MALIPRNFFLWADFFRKNRKSKEASIAAALRENLLFSTLTEAELRFLSNMVYERFYEKGEPVFSQNDRGFGLYVITRGSVDIKTQTPKGEVHITTLGSGSFFGELSLIEDENIRSATATPLEQTALIGFFKSDLLEILARRPSMGVKILLQLSMVLGRRLIETTERIPETVAHEDAA